MPLSLSADVVVPVGVGVLVAVVAAIVLVIGLQRRIDDAPTPTHDDWTREHVGEVAAPSTPKAPPKRTVAEAVAARHGNTDPFPVVSALARADASNAAGQGAGEPVDGRPRANSPGPSGNGAGAARVGSQRSADGARPLPVVAAGANAAAKPPVAGRPRHAAAADPGAVSAAAADSVADAAGAAPRPVTTAGGAAPGQAPHVVPGHARHHRPTDDGDDSTSRSDPLGAGTSDHVGPGADPRSAAAEPQAGSVPDPRSAVAESQAASSVPGPGSAGVQAQAGPVPDSRPAATEPQDGPGPAVVQQPQADPVPGPRFAVAQPQTGSVPDARSGEVRPQAGPVADLRSAAVPQARPDASPVPCETEHPTDGPTGVPAPPPDSVVGQRPEPPDPAVDNRHDAAAHMSTRPEAVCPDRPENGAGSISAESTPGVPAPDNMLGARRADQQHGSSGATSPMAATPPMTDAAASHSTAGERGPHDVVGKAIQPESAAAGLAAGSGQPADHRLNGAGRPTAGTGSPTRDGGDAADPAVGESQPVDHRPVIGGSEPASTAGSSHSVAAAVAQVLAARAAAQTPDADRRGDARDRLLAVLLDDPLRAVGAAVDLQDCQERIDRLAATVHDERSRLGDVLARLARSGLRPDQLARLSGLSDAEVAEFLRRGIGG